MFFNTRRVVRLAVVNRFLSTTINKTPLNRPSSIILIKQQSFQQQRLKSKKTKMEKQSESETETEAADDFENQITDKQTRVMDLEVKSLRVDMILKHAFGMARNKIDVLFYESKIRINGEKMLKKSAMASEGDEIDILKGVNPTNPALAIVARVEIINVKPQKEKFDIKIRRCKSLMVEKYD